MRDVEVDPGLSVKQKAETKRQYVNLSSIFAVFAIKELVVQQSHTIGIVEIQWHYI